VAMVLGAMLENDDDLVDIIRELQEAKGRGDQFNPRRLHEKIEVLGPAIDLEDLKRSIDVEIVARLGMGWDHWFGLLQKFHAREGHCHVATNHEEDGLILGRWVANQRRRKSILSSGEIDRLDQLGFSWSPWDEAWEAKFAALKKFHAREGHCRVSQNHQEEGLNLGKWVNNQRKRIKHKQLPAQIERLNHLGFNWDLDAEAWDAKFSALKDFHAREGHCRVPSNHQEDGLKLGSWVARQRFKRNELSPEQIEKLNQIGFCWDLCGEMWEANFAALQKFWRREGHCRVPQEHQEDGLKLGYWVSSTRRMKASLPREQIEQLNQIDFSWDSRREKSWEIKFAALQKFRHREGHYCPPPKHIEDGLKLGAWVSSLRQRKNSLPREQIELLNQIAFPWDLHGEAWEANFAALKKFWQREGHCRVETNHQEDEHKLGAWVSRQKKKRNTLSPDKVERLNQLGFIWDARR